MKILVVAKTDSIHTVRWLSQIADQGWEVHVFPSVLGGIVHSQLKGVIIHDDFLKFDKKVRIKPASFFKLLMASPDLIKSRLNYKEFHIKRLGKLINKINPDIIHSLEFQTAGYLVSEVKSKYNSKFPKWIATNWGSDIYYFGRFPEHEEKIREVLSGCDYYSCECQRDVFLAKQFGFTGVTLPVYPNAGGFDLLGISSFRQPGPASDRRIIMLKGYQGWAGRALIGIEALGRCADLLGDYKIKVYSVADAVSGVPEAVEKLRKSSNIDIQIIPKETSHSDILKLHGSARISIGLSITDGISTSFLETIVMGSFPIQSSTACTTEWIEDGKTGIIVPPEDCSLIEAAIRKALTNDNMINRAALANYKVAEERLSYDLLKEKTVNFYRAVDLG